MQRRQVFLASVLAGLVMFGQGCMVAAVGAGAAGTVAYLKGDLEAVESKNIDTVYRATKAALNEMGLKVTKDSKDTLGAEIVARDAGDKKITIKLKTTAENTTKLSIRVGMFGDETKSRLIYDRIREKL
ncbi:MAG TPA: DUF3568 family protein [Sedimentisphaerales bacterium]|nr:DUF3568 family protein [Sedimentisphaerales bacterium]